AAISNSNSQFAAPYLAHTDRVAHALDGRLDVSPELDLADADGAALAGRARPAKPIADDLPHGVQPQTSRHHGVAEKVTVEKPEARGDIQLGDDVTLAEFAAVQADLGDAVDHQHGRRWQLRIARAEIAAFARSEQLFLGVGRLRSVKVARVGQGRLLRHLAGGCVMSGDFVANVFSML